ncbi:MAG: YceI family protein [Candidatus Xenobia bacterium]
MRRFHLLIATVILLTALGARADQTATANWQLDPVHSLATFSVAHMGISQVRGEFTRVTGSGWYDGKHLSQARVQASIDVNTLSTREEKRDAHLKSADFLDAAKYPTITFVSQRFRQKTPTTFDVVGDLTIHGVTKRVVLEGTSSMKPVKFGDDLRMGAEATTTINRKDYGLVWNKTLDNGALLVGDDVQITLTMEFVQHQGK